MLLQQLHGMHDLLKITAATATVVGLGEALQADGGDKVLYPQHLLAEGLVDEGAVGEGEELTVTVLLAQLQDIGLTNQRLTAGEDVHIGAQLLALGDDGVQLLEGQVQPVAVLGRPAAGAVHIAGAGGVQQDGPGHVAVLSPGNLLLSGTALQAGIDDEVAEKRLPHTGIQGIDLHDQVIPVVFLLDGLPEGLALGHIPILGNQLIHQIHDLGDIGLGVLLQIGKGLGDSCADGRALGFFCNAHYDQPHFFSACADILGNMRRSILFAFILKRKHLRCHGTG